MGLQNRHVVKYQFCNTFEMYTLKIPFCRDMPWHVRIIGADVNSHALGGHAAACPYNFWVNVKKWLLKCGQR